MERSWCSGEVTAKLRHDPTQLNRQGPDFGPQYRSAIFAADDAQRRLAGAYVQQLDGARVFRGPIVTEIVPLQGFYPAEALHQDYLDKHPNDPYIVLNDRPKLDRLRDRFSALYSDRKAGS